LPPAAFAWTVAYSGTVSMLPIVLVDARNVLRSQWPNLPEEELLERCRAWAEREGVCVVAAFDGHAPGDLIGECVDSELRRRAGQNATRLIGGGGFLGELSEHRQSRDD